MRRTNTLRMADRLMGGTLEAELRRYRGAGVPFEAIARLFRDHGVEVSGETLRRWAKQLGVDNGEAA